MAVMPWPISWLGHSHQHLVAAAIAEHCSGLSLCHLEVPQPSQGDGRNGDSSLSPEMVAL